MGQYFPAFKAYDVRGIVPDEINPDLAYRIGRAFADQYPNAKKVCAGYDIRLSGPELLQALAKGLNDAGIDLINLGEIGTEMVYFATAFYHYDGGIMITASHNPPQYNGMKFVGEGSRPISSDTGLNEIEKRAFEAKWQRSGTGTIIENDVYEPFIQHLLEIVHPDELAPLHLLLDAGNGAAGITLEKLLPRTPLSVHKMLFEPDGTFPNGVPNPILEESRTGAEAELKRGKYDFGVAWDGDYDRCFFFDGEANFIEGYYIVGLLAHALLTAQPNQTIVYDPRLTWNTLDIVDRLGGKAVRCKSGHAFIKAKMREADAIYGGEMSAHHYFKSHWYCDSGMIPFLLVARLISQSKMKSSGESLHNMLKAMIAKFPCSGELNSHVTDVAGVIRSIEAKYGAMPGAEVDKLDGLSVEFPEWRFNLRGSNTEPVIRLNVETRANRDLLVTKTNELLQMIRSD